MWKYALVGVVLIVVLVYATQQTTTVRSVAPSTSNDLFTAGGKALGGLLSGLSSSKAPQPNNGLTQGPPPSGSDMTAPSVPSNFDTSNYSTSQGSMFTDTSGNFIAG